MNNILQNEIPRAWRHEFKNIAAQQGAAVDRLWRINAGDFTKLYPRRAATERQAVGQRLSHIVACKQLVTSNDEHILLSYPPDSDRRFLICFQRAEL